MLSLIKNMMSWFRTKSIRHNNVFIPATVQEDPRVHESIKRTRAAFKQQQQTMNARALKPHSATCKDPMACMKEKCFKWKPDKISGKPYALDREEEIKGRKQRQQYKKPQ